MVDGGYAWWYLDALSDDGRQGLTLIAFVGSVFSPYYAWARRRGNAVAENHNALNVALHGERTSRWSMTERGRSSLSRDADSLTIGPSALHWDGSALRMQIDEVGCPWPARLRGTMLFHPEILTTHRFTLDEAHAHEWTPIAPRGRVEVRMENPSVRWSGEAYLDANSGSAPIADAFANWSWSRAALRDGTAVLYDVERRAAGPKSLALRFDAAGTAHSIEPPAPAVLARSRWGIARHTRSDAGASTSIVRTLVDAPFYARSVLSSRLAGEPVTAIHESLSLRRFASGWVQAMLPFRMPRSLR